MTTANRIAHMNSMIASINTDQIREAVLTLSAGELNADTRFVRAHLIEEFIRRNGEEAGDRLMDEAGL